MQLVEGFANLKPQAVEMNMLTIPMALPMVPTAARRYVNQFANRADFKGPVPGAQVSIGKKQCRNGAMTVRALNLGAKGGVVDGGV